MSNVAEQLRDGSLVGSEVDSAAAATRRSLLLVLQDQVDTGDQGAVVASEVALGADLMAGVAEVASGEASKIVADMEAAVVAEVVLATKMAAAPEAATEVEIALIAMAEVTVRHLQTHLLALADVEEAALVGMVVVVALADRALRIETAQHQMEGQTEVGMTHEVVVAHMMIDLVVAIVATAIVDTAIVEILAEAAAATWSR
jgi:hypothetical protein